MELSWLGRIRRNQHFEVDGINLWIHQVGVVVHMVQVRKLALFAFICVHLMHVGIMIILAY